MSPNTTIKLQKFAEKVAIKAGKYLVSNQHSVKVVGSKILQDVVTNIDLQTQEIIVSYIQSEFPDYGIIAEEGDLKKIKEFTWIIDPIDGTKYFAKGLTTYTTLLGLYQIHEPIVGVVYNPVQHTLYSGSKGNGAFINNSPIRISNINELSKATIYATLPNIGMTKQAFSDTQNGLNKLFSSCYRVRYSANVSSAMSWIAHGAYEAFINIPGDENIWDVAAGFGILSAAGGKVTDLKGDSIKNFDLSKGILASNGKIHQLLLDLINS